MATTSEYEESRIGSSGLDASQELASSLWPSL